MSAAAKAPAPAATAERAVSTTDKATKASAAAAAAPAAPAAPSGGAKSAPGPTALEAAAAAYADSFNPRHIPSKPKDRAAFTGLVARLLAARAQPLLARRDPAAAASNRYTTFVTAVMDLSTRHAQNPVAFAALEGMEVDRREGRVRLSELFSDTKPSAAMSQICDKDLEALAKCGIDDLKLDAQPNVSKALWLVTVTPVCHHASTRAVAADASGRLCILSMHGADVAFSTGEHARAALPVGSCVGIREPCAARINGKFGTAIMIDVTNPCNAVIVPPHLAAAHAAYSRRSHVTSAAGSATAGAIAVATGAGTGDAGSATSLTTACTPAADAATTGATTADASATAPLPALSIGPLPVLTSPSDLLATLVAVAATDGDVDNDALVGTPQELHAAARLLSFASQHDSAVQLLSLAVARLAGGRASPAGGALATDTTAASTSVTDTTAGAASASDTTAGSDLRLQLLRERASLRRRQRRFDGAAADCDEVLAIGGMDGPHAQEAIALKAKVLTVAGQPHKALEWVDACERSGTVPGDAVKSVRAAAVEALAQRERGEYDMMTVPYVVGTQDEVQSYAGPVKVQRAGRKGWGVFATRAVKAGEPLIVEPSMCYGMRPNHLVNLDWADNDASGRVVSHISTSHGIYNAHRYRKHRVQFSLLDSGDATTDRSLEPPPIAALAAPDTMDDPGPQSAVRMLGCFKTTAYDIFGRRDPSKATRKSTEYLMAQFPPLDEDARVRTMLQRAPLEVPVPEACNDIVNARFTAAQLEAALAKLPDADKRVVLHGREPVMHMSGLHVLVGRTTAGSAKEAEAAKQVAVLLRQGADVNARDGLGRTAMHICCQQEKPSLLVMHVLIEGGASLAAVDQGGVTPLQRAVLLRHSAEAVKLLLAAGADETAGVGNVMPSAAHMARVGDTKYAQQLAAAGYMEPRPDIAALFRHGPHAHQYGTGIFFLLAFVNHGDAAGANARFDAIGALMFVRATRAIAKGEEVCTMYFQGESDDATKERWGV